MKRVAEPSPSVLTSKRCWPAKFAHGALAYAEDSSGFLRMFILSSVFSNPGRSLPARSYLVEMTMVGTPARKP